ncbi:DUF1924 domain-containing protein [Candidatus Halobeggiatoa sp. HSG11]|nr:DUF1924 domain-containing protein [Candidatus Halobeggiatoa sp. HSG11]
MQIKLTVILLLLSTSLYATPVDELLAEYRSEGVETFDVEAGKALWTQEFTDAKTGKIRQCSTCHTADLRNEGKHAKTGKVIKPLAPNTNPERLTKLKKIRKWFKRNCKWTLGRECNAQEKGNILLFIQNFNGE